jgi:hypothetical protein
MVYKCAIKSLLLHIIFIYVQIIVYKNAWRLSDNTKRKPKRNISKLTIFENLKDNIKKWYTLLRNMFSIKMTID